MLKSAGDVLALARAVTTDDGRADAGGEEHRCLKVAVTVGGDHRGVAAVDGRSENAATSHVARNIEAGIVLLRTLLTVTETMAHDELRVLGMERFPVEPHLLQGLGARVGEEHVRLGEKLIHDFSARLGLQIQRDEALVEVAHVESEVLVVGHGHVEDCSLGNTQRVALRGLDFDDVGTPFAEDAARGRRRHVRGKVDHLDSLEWLHVYPFPLDAGKTQSNACIIARRPSPSASNDASIIWERTRSMARAYCITQWKLWERG